MESPGPVSAAPHDGMKPSKKERTIKEGYTYTTALLLHKIRNIQEQGQLRLRSGRIADAKDLAAFMYDQLLDRSQGIFNEVRLSPMIRVLHDRSGYRAVGT